jgi:uncharacterized membrane protein YfcA
MEVTLGIFIAVAVIAFLCGYLDASLGMGYGTTLTPILLIIGFAPLAVVPVVLLGQIVGGAGAGYFHHRLGNIALDFNHGGKLLKAKERWLGFLLWSLDAKVVLLLAICGIIGAVIGVVLAVNIPEIALRLSIGAIILGTGITFLVRRNHNSPFSWRRLIGVGLLSALNKGISGGGYGPLVTGGQILSGREVKSSIGSTTVAEVLVCIVGFLAYVFLLKGDISWSFAASTAIGSVIAGPLAAFTVKRLETRKLKLAVGLLITILGALTLVTTFV